MNQIAVCLRGDVRNWNYTKEAVFKFYEGIAYSVDYYYATWDVPYIDKNELDKTFSNRKLVQGILCPSGNDRRRWGARLGPAFLSGHIKLNKRYDLVVDTRFDLIPTFIKKNHIIEIPVDDEIQTTSIDLRWKDIDKLPEDIGVTDQWAVMNQRTWDQFNYRLPLLYESWIDRLNGRPYKIVNEIELNRVLNIMNIKSKSCNWMTCILTRPCIVDIFPDPKDITEDDYFPILNNTFNFWGSLTNHKKKEYCERQGIHLDNYLPLFL
jgi:hypothetical protein